MLESESIYIGLLDNVPCEFGANRLGSFLCSAAHRQTDIQTYILRKTLFLTQGIPKLIFLITPQNRLFTITILCLLSIYTVQFEILLLEGLCLSHVVGYPKSKGYLRPKYYRNSL